MIQKRESIESVARECAHITAQIPRQVGIHQRRDALKLEPIDRVVQSAKRLQTLIANVLDETMTLRGSLACLESERLRCGLGKSEHEEMMTIAEGVMESSGFNLEDLRSRRRANVLVHVRHAVARAIVDAGFSYASTGRFLNRDHAAIIYALKGDARKRGAHR